MNEVKIVVAEDEEDIRNLIHFNLFKEKYDVHLAADGEIALDTINQVKPDLILLDLMLPKLDGVSICQKIRENASLNESKIIMLTAKSTEQDIINGLDAGADDYITKPFSPKVLIARVKAVLRRKFHEGQTSDSDLVEVHNIKLNLTEVKAFVDGTEVDLTLTEFKLLQLLSERPSKVFTRSQIVDSIRGENHAITDRSVDVQVVGLRKKLKEHGKLIETVRGVGYRMKGD